MSEPKTDDAAISSPILTAPPPRRRPLWRTALWILGVIILAAVIAYVLTPHGGGAGPGAAGAPGGRGAGGRHGGRGSTVVGVATAALGDIPITISELGSVTPMASVTVHTRIAGTLDAVYFTEGQMVRSGQLLALVDPRPYQVALEQAQGQLMRDQAALAEAKLDLNRYRILAAQNSIATQQVDLQAATVEQDAGTVKSDQAAIDSAKLNLVYCHITAPVSGRVGLRQVDPGNYIQTTDTNGVVVINEVDPITVIFTAPEDDIPQITARMTAAGGLPVTAYDRTGATVLARGKLLTLDNQIDPTTGTVKARASFANPSGSLFPDQFVNVTVLLDTLKGAVTIPAVAVRHGPQGDFVYVIQFNSTVKMTPVKVGPASGETTAITSGVSVGDEVVTDGGDRLSDGSTVILPQDAAATAARMNRKPKATGLLGWIEALFGAKPQAGGEAAAGGGATGSQGGGAGGSGWSGGQGGGAGGGQHGHGGRMMALISQLDLTPDQKARARSIFEAARQKAMGSDDPNARRQAMQGAMAQLMAILTPDQQAKLQQLRTAQQAGGEGQGEGGPRAPAPTAAPAPSVNVQPPAVAAPAASATPPATPPATPCCGWSGGGGQGGGRLAMLTGQLGLDADQQAKAKAIFAAARAKAEGSDDPDARHAAMREAMGQLSAILRPDQQAKLQAIRAAHEGGGGGGQGQ